jgi:hypothetical protein
LAHETTQTNSQRVANAGARQFFVVALFDEHDSHGTTVHAFTAPELWLWLNRAEEFPEGVEAIEVSIPDTDRLAYVTRWAPLLDKAQHLVCLPGTRSLPHPLLDVFRFGPSDTAGFRDAYGKLRAAAGDDNVIEGVW